MSQKRAILTLIFIVCCQFVVMTEAPAKGAVDGQVTDLIRLRQLTDTLSGILEGGRTESDPAACVTEIERILLTGTVTDTLALSDAFYYTGIHHFQSNRFSSASKSFARSLRFREALSLTDRRYSTGYSNLAASLAREGDYEAARQAGIRALEVRRLTSGSDSSGLANTYLNLASISSQLNDNEQAIVMAEAGLEIARLFPRKVSEKVVADLYHVIGLSLYNINEYNKSLAYCRQALTIYDRQQDAGIDSRILIHNTIALIYQAVGQPGESEHYLRRGLAIEDGAETQDKYLLYLNYARLLEEMGRVDEGERLLERGVEQASRSFGGASRQYFTMLVGLAAFVDQSLHDHVRSLALYDSCFSYVRHNPWDHIMRKFVTAAYATALYSAGRYKELLEVTEEEAALPQASYEWRYNRTADSRATDRSVADGRATDGRVADGRAADRRVADGRATDEWVTDGMTGENGRISASDLAILNLRYASLNALSASSSDTLLIRKAIATGRQLTSIYDRRRLEMTDDESRTNLSSSSRDVYTGLVGNYAALYNEGAAPGLVSAFFEFTERSKMAGFLSSIREVNAARFSLPVELVTLDATIRSQTGLYRELIAREEIRAAPDTQRLATWEGLIFRLVRSRDSLIRLFEEEYPAYYNLKYRSEVTPSTNITRVIGRHSNLLSYVLTETKLYTFVANQRHQEIITHDIDSSFIASLYRFRELLTTMPRTSDTRAPFNEYMDLAYSLYRVLLEPALPYLRGDKIVISPDNILSYIPFEALVTEEFRSQEMLYRDAPFALKRFRFSYIYSVTLSSETMERSRRFNNRVAAFAPSYSAMEIADSLLVSWPTLRSNIRELPYALLEAEDVVRQCGGTAFLGEEAGEERFKREAAGYKIIHLATHALVDDRQPAFSKILFAGGDKSEDGMLNTYEIYSMHLNAMLVVLSSCNTGVGRLVSGEGILSLARGFLYAGSRSVVMSMWEVEDVSASLVTHSFYRNMRAGQTKSAALRSARLRFLREADQTRSHPYYWATLVIYGDDTPLWYNHITLYLSLLGVLAAGTVLMALYYRGPRS